jgi:hypothetical protein
MIYTTKIIEGYHRQLRKVTKTKTAYPNDEALIKIVYLATMDIYKKWTMPVREWGSEKPPLSPAEPCQALGLPSGSALSSWQVKAMYIIPNLCQTNSKSVEQALRDKAIYTKIFILPINTL